MARAVPRHPLAAPDPVRRRRAGGDGRSAAAGADRVRRLRPRGVRIPGGLDGARPAAADGPAARALLRARHRLRPAPGLGAPGARREPRRGRCLSRPDAPGAPARADAAGRSEAARADAVAARDRRRRAGGADRRRCVGGGEPSRRRPGRGGGAGAAPRRRHRPQHRAAAPAPGGCVAAGRDRLRVHRAHARPHGGLRRPGRERRRAHVPGGVRGRAPGRHVRPAARPRRGQRPAHGAGRDGRRRRERAPTSGGCSPISASGSAPRRAPRPRPGRCSSVPAPPTTSRRLRPVGGAEPRPQCAPGGSPRSPRP